MKHSVVSARSAFDQFARRSRQIRVFFALVHQAIKVRFGGHIFILFIITWRHLLESDWILIYHSGPKEIDTCQKYSNCSFYDKLVSAAIWSSGDE